MQEKVNKVVRRKKDAEGGFSYTCLLSDFSCVGRKGIMEYLKSKHEEEYSALQEEVGAELGKLIMNAAFLEEKKEAVKAAAKTNGVAKTNGMSDEEKKVKEEERKAKAAEKAKALEEKKALQQAARDKATAERLAAEEKRKEQLEAEKKKQKELEEKKKAELEAEEEEKRVEEEAAAAGRVDYPMTMEVLRKIDARTVRIPEYGSLVGRLARLLAVVVGKKDGATYDFKLDKPIAGDIMAHLEAEHADFLELLYTIFPPAKKRMGQFVEKAADRFELRVPTAREVDKLEAEGKRKEQERVKKEREEEQERIKKEREEETKKIKEKREAEEKEREALRQKRKLEWEETRKEQEAKRRKIQEEAEKRRNTPETEKELINRLKREASTMNKALKKMMKTTPAFKTKALEKRLAETRQKLDDVYEKRYNKQQDEKTAVILEKLSPKQLRKLCMAYFGILAEEGEKVTWKDTMESVKMEVDFSFLADFLLLLHHHAKVNFKKTFKFGHMLVTSKQSELIFTKGLRPVCDGLKDDSWRLPSSWEVDNPPEELGEEWNRKHDSRLIIACYSSRARFVNNFVLNNKFLARGVVQKYPDMKKLVLDDEGGVLPHVKDRFVYLVNVYMNRGVYSEEFGDVFYKEDVEGEDVNAEDDVGEDEIMEVTEEASSNGTKAEAKDTKEPVVVAEDSSEPKEAAPAEVLVEAAVEADGAVEMTEAEENELLGDDVTEEDM